MEPIIYKLPTSADKPIKLQESNIYFDKNPSPKLIKYGYNNIVERLDFTGISAGDYYKAGLEVDFDRKDADSIKSKINKTFSIKSANQTFAELWEILNFFGILGTKQQIMTNEEDAVNNVVDIYLKISASKHKITVNPIKSTKDKATVVIKKYSDIDIDENAVVQFIIDDLPELMNSQEKGSNLILQIFSIQTQVMVELIYYLSTLYTEAYIVKPMIDSDLFDSKYLVLLGLKESVKISIPKHAKNAFLACILDHPIPESVSIVVQCLNTELIPKKIYIYDTIKKYLDSKVYEGATYQEMIELQNKNTMKWLETFVNVPKMKSLLDDLLSKSDKKCSNRENWTDMYN
jgi:hypothetical protein